MKHISKIFFTMLLLFMVTTSCDQTELDDLLNNPNSVTPDNAELGFLYDNVMLEFVEFVDEASDETMPYTRMVAMTGGNRYDNQDRPSSFDFIWSKAYSELMPDIDLSIQLAEEGGLTVHSGSLKVIKAYILFVMVDLFGDIPYSEAFQGIVNPSPVADDDAAVYEIAFGLLDAAIADLQTPAADNPGDRDLYYEGDEDAWIKLANTLKLRYYINTRLLSGNASAVNGLLGNLISDSEEDFEFPYGNNRDTPDARHPYYSDGYETGGPSWYLSNYYMWTFFGEKSTEDPRLRYYFYRQDCDETDEDTFTLDCQAVPYPAHWPPGLPWCTASSSFGDPLDNYGGYWGRDHGNNDGIPPDDLKRTAWGLYPAGGKFDNDDCSDVSNSGVDGERGAGIQPIMLASWVDFMRAEAALTMGTSDNARTLLESGIRKSIDKVMGFAAIDIADTAYIPKTEDVDDYIDEVLTAYDAASSSGKLDIIIKEYHLAAHGNGIEPYNSYRRTGFPSSMQPTREVDPGTFTRSFWYPASYINRNSSASQKGNIDTQIFWDTNPAGFID